MAENKDLDDPTEFDVVVVGAGPSGLAAANYLMEKGSKLSIAVVDARKRVGGRTFSQRFESGVTYDLGGQWIGAKHTMTTKLLKELGVSTQEQYHRGTKILDMDGKIHIYNSEIPAGLSAFSLLELAYITWHMDKICETMDAVNPSNSPDAQNWDKLSFKAWMDKTIWNDDVKVLLIAMVRALFGLEPEDLSMLYCLCYAKSSGGFDNLIKIKKGNQEKTCIGGTQQLSQGLALRFQALGHSLFLDSPVLSITHHATYLGSDGGVLEAEDSKGFIQVKCANRSLRARYVIIATSPTIAAKINYEPRLPPARNQLFQRAFMGGIIKVVVLYSESFWRTKGWSGEVIGDGVDGPLFNVFDNCAPKGKGETQAALVGFINGDPARVWSLRPAEERKAAVLAQLIKWFGPEAGTPTEYVEQDWLRDPWSAGCPVTAFSPGALWSVGHVLRTPVGNIHWAGTELATEHAGFIEGALRSGERAAQEVLKKIDGVEEQPLLESNWGGEYGAKGQARRRLETRSKPKGGEFVFPLFLVFLAILMFFLLKWRS